MHCALLHYRLRHHLACTAQAGESTGTTNIDPDGDGGVVAFNARCDQDSNGGGWMLVATRRYDSNPKSAGAYGTDLTGPDSDVDNLYKQDWTALQFTDIWVQIGLSFDRTRLGASDKIGANCYFEDFTFDDEGDAQRAKWKEYWYQNRNEFTMPKPCRCFDIGDANHGPGIKDGSVVNDNCGSKDSYSYGPLGDPGMGDQSSTGWCWWGYEYHGSSGTGSCQGSFGSAYGFNGRAWVRGARTTTTTLTTTTTTVTTVTSTTITSTSVTSTTSTDTYTTNTMLQALTGRMSEVETLLEAQIQLLTATLTATQDRVKVLEDANQVLTDEQTAMKNAATVAVKAAAAAVPCATFESSINAEGEAICTMKVDKVESLRTNDD